MKKTYLIKYKAYVEDGSYYDKKCKMKNCLSSLHAKSKLEDFLKRKHKDFKKLVIETCNEDPDLGVLGDFNNIFKDIFGGNKL